MSQQVNLDTIRILTDRSYPLPIEHNSIDHNVNRSNSKRSLGLGVNEKTGRVQWCPGITCCKFLILIPVMLLPLTLVLILLMRMDSMLLALRINNELFHNQNTNFKYGEQMQLHSRSYLDDYDNKYVENYENDDNTSVDEDTMQTISDESKLERIKRCMNFKYGLKESLDLEERDIMKDSRTAFLPFDTTSMPRECLEAINDEYDTNSFDIYKTFQSESTKKRTRRRSDANAVLNVNATFITTTIREHKPKEIASSNEQLVAKDPEAIDFEASIHEGMDSFKSFWNEHGTKESIRAAQARTMKRHMDPTIDPCVDFYKFSCGNWKKLHPIPKDKAGFDTFEMLRESLDLVLKQLLESDDAFLSETTMPKIETLKDISNNDYNTKIKTADITDGTSDTDKTLTVDDTKNEKSNEELREKKSASLRKHIVSRRHILSEILMRYKRQLTNSKRKRLITYSNVDTKIVSSMQIRNAKQKARFLYKSCINSNLLNQRGIQPLLKLIEELGGWPLLKPNWSENKFDWLELTANLRRYNNDILIVQWVGPDIKNSDENIIQFDQTSLGLPTREYFLQDVNAKYLNAYQKFMTEVMQRLGASPEEASKTAGQLIIFETQLASITAPAEERLNVTKLYKRMTIRRLHDKIPAINWQKYLTILQQRSVHDDEEVVIYAMDYMQELVNLLSLTEPRTVANYLLWRFVRHRINNVDERFEEIKQNFYHSLFGREESPSRWKVCVAQVNTNMGMALGAMFVQKYFDENSKRDTLRMTHELQQAFREILKSTDWLDTPTKQLAEEKVNAMSLKIGYPDFILNPKDLNEKYAGIDIHPDRYFENTLNVLLHTARTEQKKLHETVNKTNWQTAPAIVNAYYSRNKNQIMFPAGILQPPFYHRHFPRSLNFGGIGVVIGHELTHGFDDKGRLFDRNGSIHKWWTDASIKGFDERARCIIAQYNNYTVGEVGISLNGESTQGENIADNGGIRQAFHAYKRWLRDNPEAAKDERLPDIDMTGEQLFFLNFGQVWCGAMRPEAVRNKLNTAIHSPGRFRVIGTVSNSYDFAKEFKCPLGSPMNPKHKCSVW